jgi:hypothetical protein
MNAQTEFSATDRQREYLHDLLNQQDLTASIKWMDATQGMDEGELKTAHAALHQRVDGRLGKREASDWIEKLKALPASNIKGSGGHWPSIETDVPAGHYAVTGEDGTTDFYRVDKPTEGKWAGRTFVKLQLSEVYERLSLSGTRSVLKKIQDAGPREAAIRYGKEIGRCAICNRTLTNNESIERGIGPVCAEARGW